MRVLVLDVGNVLVHWDPRRLYDKLLDDPEPFLATVCTPAVNHALDRGARWADVAPGLLARFPEQRALIEAWRARHLEMYAGPVDGMTAMVERYKRTGRPLWGLTNFSAETWPSVRDAWPLLQELDEVVVSGQEGLAKPEAALYARLEARAGLPPDALCFVDDRAENVAAARERGWHAHRFRDAATLEAWLWGSGGRLLEDADPG